MGDQRQAPTADRILVAQLTGEARRHAQWRPLTAEEGAAALAELRALAAGRADLLAEVAGILEGTSEGELDEPLARSAARLCREAGADLEAIPAWIEEGRRRSANARRPPFSGGLGSGRGGPGLTAAGRCRFSRPHASLAGSDPAALEGGLVGDVARAVGRPRVRVSAALTSLTARRPPRAARPVP
jgi:hypothetical protein